MARNPKDAIVSFYYHHTLFQKFYNYKGDLSQFARYFMNDLGNIQYNFIVIVRISPSLGVLIILEFVI